ncbi:single-stranded DNA-binding protein [Prevotella pallens]|uniref:single-stranded DNA-binding protein n=1 Tax=Prevotella pallens TaxID=60133 RepID=UPI0028E26107|nr:single-stranded DNA-binding protein [Prevotella pallens]
MKKRYDSPITEVVIMDVTQNFLVDSAHGAHHEGFSEGADLSPHVEDGTDDDSPF